MLVACLTFALPVSAASQPLSVRDELDAAQQLAAAIRAGKDGITIQVPSGFDFNLCYEYARMIYPDYYGITWQVRTQVSKISVDMAQPQQHQQAIKEAKRVAGQMMAAGLSERELLRAFHDYLIQNCTYDYNTFLNMNIASPEPFSAYGALLGGKAVCDGYSAAFAMLCAAADIPCIYIGSDELNHSWNAVFTDGQVLFVDVTYDDKDDPNGATSYENFLRTRKEFLSTHKGWDPTLCDAMTAYLWPENYASARTLYRLGLFRGSDKGFELDRQPRRDEAAVMLTRFLGLEDEALDAQGLVLPFSDVSDFYKPYIAFLYDSGLTTGTSARTYSPSTSVTAQQYMTFMLRGLGYSDAAGDFSWSSALQKAVELGILTTADMQYIQSRTFDRGMMAFVSVKVLTAVTKQGTPLYQQLIGRGALTQKLAEEVLEISP